MKKIDNTETQLVLAALQFAAIILPDHEVAPMSGRFGREAMVDLEVNLRKGGVDGAAFLASVSCMTKECLALRRLIHDKIRQVYELDPLDEG